ncbi:MAG: cupredoxin domain-containing protein [Candidatus Saccharimonadales bacterium]
MSVEYPSDHTQPPADLLPDDSKDASYKRKVISSSLLVLIILVAITSVVAFRGGSGVFHGGSKVSAATPAQIAPAAVSITDSGFVPATVTIKVGQAVVWTNDAVTSHFVISDDPVPLKAGEPQPNSVQSIKPGDTYSYVFNQAGSYGYHDTIDPSFQGTVVVKQ